MNPAQQRRTLDAAEALFSSSEGSPPKDRLRDVVAELSPFLSRGGTRVRLPFLFALWFMTWMAPLLHWRLPPFGRLPIDARVAIWTRGETGLLAPVYVLLKVMLCLVYFEHPDVAGEFGYDPLGRSSTGDGT